MWHEIVPYAGKHDAVIGYCLVFLAALLSSAVALATMLENRRGRIEARDDARKLRERDEQKEKEKEEDIKVVQEVGATVLRGAMDTDAMNQAILAAINAALIIADKDNIIESWNDSACALFGWTEHEAVGRPVTLIIPQEMRGAHLAGFARYRETGLSSIIGETLNMKALHKNGRLVGVTLCITEGRKTNGDPFFCGLLFPIPPPSVD